MHVANLFCSLHHLCCRTGKMGIIFVSSSVIHSFSVFCFVFFLWIAWNRIISAPLFACMAFGCRWFIIHLTFYRTFVRRTNFRSMFFLSFFRQCSVLDVRCSSWKIHLQRFFSLVCLRNERQTIRIFIFMHITHSIRLLRDQL